MGKNGPKFDIQNIKVAIFQNWRKPVSVAENSTLSDIQEVNLSYLMLAQRLLRDNYAAGMFRLGVNRDTAETILELSPAQMVKLAGSSALICRFRLDDHGLLTTLTQDVLGGVLQQAHSTILLSQQPAEHLA
jgi:flagellar transcriptional activator FlhD